MLCHICEVETAVPHQHHIIPREYGGEQGPTIPLCGNCHTRLHAEAEAVLSYKRTGKHIKSFWSSSRQAKRASPLVAAIVQSALDTKEKKTYKLNLEIDSATYKQLHLFKKDQGFTSLEQAVLFCVRNCKKLTK